MSRQAPITDGAELERAWSRGMPDGYEQEEGGAVSAQEAGYLPPDQGPFECSNCSYFVAEGQPCQKVAEPVQAEGHCNLFVSAGAETQEQEHTEAAGADSSDTASFQ